MENPLFSTYRQGENRVTSSILAVLERISFALVEQILQGVLQEPETRLVTFSNQVTGPTSVPDGRVRASFSYWIETKIEPNAVRTDQIRAHIAAMDADGSVESQRLLILTPDHRQSSALSAFSDDDRVVWASFHDLMTSIEDSLADADSWLTSNKPIATERERDLLRELVQFIVAEGLLGPQTPQVLVVAGRRALPDYHSWSAYVCQANRTFQRTEHIAFYTDGKIDRHVPRIQDRFESIVLDETAILENEGIPETPRHRLAELCQLLRDAGNAAYGKSRKVLLLSSPRDAETIVLEPTQFS